MLVSAVEWLGQHHGHERTKPAVAHLVVHLDILDQSRRQPQPELQDAPLFLDAAVGFHIPRRLPHPASASTSRVTTARSAVRTARAAATPRTSSGRMSPAVYIKVRVRLSPPTNLLNRRGEPRTASRDHMESRAGTCWRRSRETSAARSITARVSQKPS